MFKGIPFLLLAAALPLFSQPLPSGPYKVRIGQPAPALQLGSLLQGELPSSASGRSLVIEFWATWCAPCREAIPHLNELADKFRGRGIDFLFLSSEPADKVKQFLRDHAMNGTVAIDEGEAMFQAYGAGLPTTVLISRHGTVAAITHPSLLDAPVLDALLADRPLPLKMLDSINVRTPLVGGTTVTDEDALVRVVIKPAQKSAVVNYEADQIATAGTPLKHLLAFVYDIPQFRIELAKQFERQIYAVQAWVPPGNKAMLKPMLQSAVVAAVGLRVRREQRTMDVLVLSGLPGKLQPMPTETLAQGGMGDYPGLLEWEGATIEQFRDSLQDAVKMPVVIDHAPDGKFSVKLTWDPSRPRSIESAIREQLGLDLKPAKRPLDVLVVDSADESVPKGR